MTATREVAATATVAPEETPYERLKPGPGRTGPEVAEHQRGRIHAAMIELACSRGYQAVTTRELARLSGVSTRSFYKHFESKEDCFARTHELIVQRTARRVVAGQAGERDWRERLRLAFAAFTREVAREPQGARLALIEACSAGPAALERVRHAESLFEAMLAESLNRALAPVVVPRTLVKGIVAGVEHVVRVELQAGQESRLRDLSDLLVQWALSFVDPEAVASLAMLELAVPAPGSLPVMHSKLQPGDLEQQPAGNRTLLLAAAAKLTANGGYERLTAAKICRSAGVSRRNFNRHFESVGDCFLAVLEQQAHDAIEVDDETREPAGSWAGDVQRTIAGLCAQVASSPLFARLLFVEPFAAGAPGIACRERLIDRAAGRMRCGAPSYAHLSEPEAVASVGAVWGVLCHCVTDDKAQAARRLAPTLSYLALAPAVGARQALNAISAESQTPSPTHS